MYTRLSVVPVKICDFSATDMSLVSVAVEIPVIVRPDPTKLVAVTTPVKDA